MQIICEDFANIFAEKFMKVSENVKKASGGAEVCIKMQT